MARRHAFMLGCVLAAQAHASPRSDPTTGRAVFTGATMPSATSIMLDPAAIGIGPVDEIYVAVAAVLDRIHIDHQSLALDGTLSDAGSLHATPIGPGGQLAVLWHFGRVTLGASFGSPPVAPYISNQDAIRYHILGGDLRDYVGAIAASFKVTDDFYFGVSAALDDMRLHLHYLRDTGLDNGHGPRGVDSDCGGHACGVEDPAAAERYDIHARSLTPFSDYIVNLGLAYQLAQNVWLAAAYHTAPGNAIQSELHGSSEVTLAPRDGGQTLAGYSTVYASLPASVDVELRARLRQDLDLHVGFRWEDLSRFSAYDVRTYGDSYIGTDVAEWTERARGMHDPFALWAGVEQVDTGAPILLFGYELPVRFGARIGYETSSVDDARISPLTIAPASATVDVGMQVRRSNVVLQLSYGLQYFFPVTVTDSAFDPRDRPTCIDSGFDYSTAACAAVRNGYAIPSAAGHYDRVEHAIRLGLVYEFPDVVVYGATGVVGRRICRALAGTSFTTAGRDTAPADDPAALAHAFRGAEVVINAATGVTEPIVVAALAAGAHVVDTGGSQDITHAIYERHESTARHAGRVCVLGAGLDCAIGDLAASWAALHVCGASDPGDTIRDRPMPRLAADRPLDDVAISYIYDDLVLSPSSQRALFSRLHARPLVWKRDRWESVTAGAERRRVNAGREMGERDVVSFPGGDVISVPRHLASKNVQTFVSTTRSTAATTGLRLLARAMRFVPKRAADLLAPYAFADDDYARTRFAIVVQARRGFAAAQVVVSGTDIYATTAAIATWIGRALVGRPQGPLGMRAPSELFRAEPALREIAANASLTIEPGFG